LSEENILNTVEALTSIPLNNLCLQRNSYINRVYELEKQDPRERLIVKFYRPNRWTKTMILEEHRFVQELAIKDIPVIPPLIIEDKTLFSFNNIPFTIFPKKGGRALDELDDETWIALGRLIARIHVSGAQHKKSTRITWRPSEATQRHLAILLAHPHIPEDFVNPLKTMTELFIKKADPLFNKQDFILLHGDCHKGNLIHRPGEGTYILDFDDMCFGPPIQDLWMLLSGPIEHARQEFNLILEGYEMFRAFPYQSVKIVPSLRAMRIIHFASWCAIQSSDPDFNHHFPEWGTPRYWNGLIRDLQSIVYSDLEQPNI